MSRPASSPVAPAPAPRTSSPAPPASEDLPLIAALQEDFLEAGFTHDGLVELLGPHVVAALHREQVVPG